MVKERYQRKIETDFVYDELPDGESWSCLVCENGHVEEIKDPTENLLWFCPECGSRRVVVSNPQTPKTTKTDKI